MTRATLSGRGEIKGKGAGTFFKLDPRSTSEGAYGGGTYTYPIASAASSNIARCRGDPCGRPIRRIRQQGDRKGRPASPSSPALFRAIHPDAHDFKVGRQGDHVGACAVGQGATLALHTKKPRWGERGGSERIVKWQLH